jgi:acyl carrier protein phosphodiesterase
MTISAAALSDQAISYREQPTVVSHAPTRLERWKDELWSQAEQRLEEFVFLEDDWDGAGAEPPSLDALRATVEFLQQLFERDESPPTALSPTALGSIVLEWRLSDGYLEAEISGRNLIGWMRKDPNGSIEAW